MASWLDNVSKAIPLKWKLLGLAVGLLFFVVVIGGTYAYTLSRGIELGELREKDKNKDAANTALENAIKERDEAYAELWDYEQEILATPPDQIRPSDDLIKQHYKRLRGE